MAMGRKPGSMDLLHLDDEQAAALDELLGLLGVSVTAVADAPSKDARTQYTVELFQSEREALDDAALALGLSRRSGARLVRLIARAWLGREDLHPSFLLEADLGDGHDWATAVEAIRSETAWLEGSGATAATVAAALAALDEDGLAEFVESLDEEQRQALRRALDS